MPFFTFVIVEGPDQGILWPKAVHNGEYHVCMIKNELNYNNITIIPHRITFEYPIDASHGIKVPL